MIDLTKALSIAEAAKSIGKIGRGGRPVAFSTIWRWIFRGAKAPDGRVVRLEAVRLGSKWVTDPAALQLFSERLTPVLGEAAAVTRTPTARRRATARAAAELSDAGIA